MWISPKSFRALSDREQKKVLDQWVERFNEPGFIPDDPISIPHQFSGKQDIEIMGFWVAVLAWGRRQTIIDKANQLIRWMDGAPYDFVVNHSEEDRKPFTDFRHRTFQPTDALYFLEFFQQYYRNHNSLETAFSKHLHQDSTDISEALDGFRNEFFNLPYAPKRTEKHVAAPHKGSNCKRLNMFLRWMVRDDENGVDFGLWKRIKARQLCVPLDVHVGRKARALGLLRRKQRDWKAVLELTDRLKQFDPEDPARYDFALFGMSIAEKKGWFPGETE